jgi:hypothetical protein
MMKTQQRNMSQSSGAPGGFNMDKTEINERLQLLKSTFKYKNASEFDREEVETYDNSNPNMRPQRGLQPQGGLQPTKANSEYAARNNINKGPSATNNNFLPKKTEIAPAPDKTQNSFMFSAMSSNVDNINLTHTNSFGANATENEGFQYGGRAGVNQNQLGSMPQVRGNTGTGMSGPVKAKAL